MPRNRLPRLLTSLCLLVLLAGIATPVFASPDADAPPSLGSVWQALTAWLDGVIDSVAGSELNIGPYPEPNGHTATSTGGGANLIPYPDPHGRTGTSSELNIGPFPDPAGHAATSSELNIGPYPDPAGKTATSTGGELNIGPFPDPNG